MKNLITVIFSLAALAAVGGVVYSLKLPFDVMNVFSVPYNYENGGRYTAGDTQIDDRVSALDVDWVTGSVTIGYHDENTVTVKEVSKQTLDDASRLRWCMEDGTLTIKYARAGARLKNDLNKQLFITLPRGTELSDTVIDGVTCDVVIDGGSYGAVNIDSTTGHVDVTADRVDSLIADTVTGAVKADVKSAGEMKLKCTTGKINIAADSFESISASATTGGITARLPKTPGYSASLSAVTGKVQVQAEHKNDGKLFIVGDGSRQVTLKTVTGDVTVS